MQIGLDWLNVGDWPNRRDAYLAEWPLSSTLGEVNSEKDILQSAHGN